MTRNHCRWAAALGVALALPAAAWSEDPWWVVKPRPPAPGANAPGSPIVGSPAATLGRPVARPSIDPPIPVAAPVAPAWGTPTTDAAPVPAWNMPTAPSGMDVSGAPPVQVAMPAGYDETPGGLLPPRVARGQPPDPAPPGARAGRRRFRRAATAATTPAPTPAGRCISLSWKAAAIGSTSARAPAPTTAGGSRATASATTA